MSIRNLDALLDPKSVVVVGASDVDGSVGATVWRNLRSGSFAGTTTPVHPLLRQLDGVAVLRRCADLAAPHDLAIVCTAPDTLAQVIAELAAAGTRAAIVLTPGVDAALQQTLRELARPTTMRLMGGDCLGVVSPHIGLNAGFVHTHAHAGPLAFVSQSGTLVSTVLDWSASRQLGFSHVVSVGQQMDVDFGDLLDHLASDAATRAILLYVESISSARKFMSAARAAARNKPVIVVKPGAGATAGSDAVFDAAIRRAGMLRVQTLQDLFVAAETLARFDADVERGLTILSNGNGAAALAADCAARLGVRLNARPAPGTSRLDATRPFEAARDRVVGSARDTPIDRCVAQLESVLADPSQGAILFMHSPSAAVHSSDLARACLPSVAPASRRLLACWLGDASAAEARHLFDAAGVADFETPEQAVQAFSMLADYRHNQAMLLEAPSTNPHGAPDRARALAIVAAALDAGRETLDEVDSLSLLEAYGIPVAKTARSKATPDDAVAVAERIGYPVALKILSPDLQHKSHVCGVRLDIAGEGALRVAAREILGCVGALRPDARITGFSVQAMGRRSPGKDLVCAARIDATFGPVLMLAPVHPATDKGVDPVYGLPPLNRVLARDMVTRAGLGGPAPAPAPAPARLDLRPADADALCDVLVALARMQADLPRLAALEIDPLRVDAQGVVALDAHVRLSATPAAGPAQFAIMPFPEELTERIEWQGRSVLIRAVRPEDEALHRAFIARVAPDDLRLRFFSSRRELPRSELARLVQIDYAREMAFIALDIASDGTVQTLGVARAVCDPDNVDAEFAVLVRSDVQGHRLGSILLAKLIRNLRDRATRRIVGYVLRENLAMRRLVEKLGFEIASLTNESGAVYYVLELQAPIDSSGLAAPTPADVRS